MLIVCLLPIRYALLVFRDNAALILGAVFSIWFPTNDPTGRICTFAKDCLASTSTIPSSANCPIVLLFDANSRQKPLTIAPTNVKVQNPNILSRHASLLVSLAFLARPPCPRCC